MSHRLLTFRAPLEVWGGVECTINRVGAEYFDQLQWNGHYQRPDDLDAIAGLGVRTLRYPVLWEKVAPNYPDEYDWTFPDERLQRLRDLAVKPIAGLVHHGSGPSYTSLLDPEFPEKLAHYARAVATRYPWLEYYTPVNEPLTTARFSGLYGHWYPHRRDDATFIRALLNQCRGVALAMSEIRKINPAAKLVQTEDMSRIFSTRLLAYQAEFENERRWLSFDLLCGRVGGDHAMAQFFEHVGISSHEYLKLLETPCPPDILGINYYLTSERFLDERLERYPASEHGGNGRHEYADVAAVRVSSSGIAGAGSMLSEAWKRYGLPMAITEAHLGCTREEQVRWLWEVWNEAHAARRSGADVRAVAVWSLLGAYNWNSLVTCNGDHYEPGIFDLRGGKRRPTLLARVVQDLAAGRRLTHPLLAVRGWWRQPSRLLHPVAVPHQPRNLEMFQHRDMTRSSKMKTAHRRQATPAAKPVLITGMTGTLGQAFARECRSRHLLHHLSSRRQMDVANRTSVASFLERHQPWAVVNTAGYVRVDDAEADAERCSRENCEGALILAEECAKRNIALLTFSSDLVFDGEKETPYLESDPVRPLNAYGRSKAEAEQRVLQAYPAALVVRTSAFFGPWDEHNFANLVIQVLCDEQTFVAAEDSIVSPTYVPDLVRECLDLMLDGVTGIRHVANSGQVSWADFARLVARVGNVTSGEIQERPSVDMGWLAPRPRYSALASEEGIVLPPLEDAVGRYFQDRARYLESLEDDLETDVELNSAVNFS